ncbi:MULTISPECIES: DinB family protein [unclassified Streptomyces]|uniref:DinB family protein n=1 Tax=unclassified Streptomyces TaxID=2593676 RepID=UPI002DD9AC13|nr:MULTISPECIES: DinB family protein [unclassified Streptomyces]WSF85993.1 DinB family protein [Streptomyces sp. NBC_01744]WSC37723.1 DinB family protein [Streptomyces sp. NBC_01763]WSC45834.1 DinB family protein [Streptomyces sp. NBC_01762]WSC55157.1 DinB family protein [Streptomyces sp. NBC_01761]WSD25498.1 DinB family protein [Streptomyces sp. NBC_01751]
MVTHVPAEAHGDERGALLSFVEAQRGAIRRSLIGLTEEQAASRPSASELSLSGLLKHVAETELNWLRLAQQRPNEKARTEETWADSFRLVGDETVPQMLESWAKVAAETEQFVHSVESMNDTFPLPEAPWFPQDEKCSMRWLLVHLVEEIARHAGHADIIRESLDGRTAFELIAQEAGYPSQS